MLAIKPAPYTGVGVRNTRLPVAACAAKLGCWITDALHPGASVRPAMVKMSWTPPSGVPSGFLINRASRTGPLLVTKKGTRLVAPSRVATFTCGLIDGLEPPIAGCAWQPAQLFKLKRGPRPLPSSPFSEPDTESTSLNAWRPALKNDFSESVKPAI